MRPQRMRLQHKLTLAHLAATWVAVLIAEAIAATVLVLAQDELTWGLTAVLVAFGAGLAGLLLGAWVNRRILGRLDHFLRTSQAWLGGDLSARIADPVADDLGQLAEHLDLLAEHLAQDERDLDKLRERNRLARQSYDNVKQHLFSLTMTASAIRTRFDNLANVPEDLIEMVREVEVAAQAAQRETTRLIEDP